VTVKIIILKYLVNWSKELREGDGKMLTNGMEFFCFF
jgi:hypothetical protein